MDRARKLAAEQVSPHVDLIRHDPRLALAMGWLTPTEAPMTDQKALLEEVYIRYLLLELGQALCMVGEHAESARCLGALAHLFLHDPRGMRAAARAAAATAHPKVLCNARCGCFEREIFTYWGAAAELADPRGAGAAAVYQLAVDRGVWRWPMQRPLEHYDPSLPASWVTAQYEASLKPTMWCLGGRRPTTQPLPSAAGPPRTQLAASARSPLT